MYIWVFYVKEDIIFVLHNIIIMKILAVVFCVMLLSSCFWESKDVIKAKQDMWIIETPVTATQESANNWTIEEWVLDETPVEVSSWSQRIQVKNISWKEILELWDLDYSDFKKWYAKILGKTLWNVSQITVEFSNDDSTFPNDAFTLRKFSAGDATFEYNASSRFKVLDFGLSVVSFAACSQYARSICYIYILPFRGNKILNPWPSFL